MSVGEMANPFAAPESHDSFDFDVSDVTQTRSFRARGVQRSLPAGVVARTLAARLNLPDNVPWTLREDSTSAYLDDRQAIGEQIRPDAKVTLSPVAHLG